jgi:hypothetical protein
MHGAKHEESHPRNTLRDTENVATNSMDGINRQSHLMPDQRRTSLHKRVTREHAEKAQSHCCHGQHPGDRAMQVDDSLPHDNEESRNLR